MHKTGGQSIAELLQRLDSETQMVGYHYPASYLPDSHSEKPILIFIRSPWKWYASWYAFNVNNLHGNNPLFKIFSNEGKDGFEATISRMLRVTENSAASAHTRSLLQASLPESIAGNRMSGITRGDIENLSESDGGYLNWLFRRMINDKYGGNLLTVGRHEYLQDDLVRFLSQFYDFDSPLFAVDVEARKNVSDYGGLEINWGDSLVALANERERQLITDFGYPLAPEV